MIYKFNGIVDVEKSDTEMDVKVIDAIEASTGGTVEIMFMVKEDEEDE